MPETAGDLTSTDGTRAVELARKTVETFVKNDRREQLGSMRDAFYTRAGAFVRLESTRGLGQLRGCAGTYDDSEHVGRAIVDAAIQAASDDSCGSSVDAAELSTIRVSLCIVDTVTLTDDPLADIEIGRHGVAVERGGNGGWLYPTVPVENNWSPAEYLDRACRKAGLPATAWEEDASVTLFDGHLFRERKPNGSIQKLE